MSLLVATLSLLHCPMGSFAAEAGFVSLFDGKTTKGWHGFKRTDMPKSWSAKGGALTLTPGEDGGDISSDGVFADFELSLEWRISRAGNSGIMYRADEGHAAAYLTGPEMQVLDDAGHRDGRKMETSAGSCYGLYPSIKTTLKRVGGWNGVRIIARGNHIEHWLNGVRGVSYELWSPEWVKRVAASKFAWMPDYGTNTYGHIVLQDHGDVVSFRNIRIKKL